MCGTRFHKGSKPFQSSALLLIKANLLRSRNLFTERSLLLIVYHKSALRAPQRLMIMSGRLPNLAPSASGMGCSVASSSRRSTKRDWSPASPCGMPSWPCRG